MAGGSGSLLQGNCRLQGKRCNRKTAIPKTTACRVHRAAAPAFCCPGVISHASPRGPSLELPAWMLLSLLAFLSVCSVDAAWGADNARVPNIVFILADGASIPSTDLLQQ